MRHWWEWGMDWKIDLDKAKMGFFFHASLRAAECVWQSGGVSVPARGPPHGESSSAGERLEVRWGLGGGVRVNYMSFCFLSKSVLMDTYFTIVYTDDPHRPPPTYN